MKDLDLTEIRLLRGAGRSVEQLARKFDVSMQCIEAIIAGLPWRKYLADGGADLLQTKRRTNRGRERV